MNLFIVLHLKVFYFEYVVLSVELFEFQLYNVFHQLSYLVEDQLKPKLKSF